MNNKENRIALIPARLESTRLPEKLLLPLGDKAIIVRTYEAVLASGLFNRVIVVCNHERIAQVLKKHNCAYILDTSKHESGTDRIAAMAQNVHEEIIVNIQGDEPFVQKGDLEALISLFDNDKIDITSLKTPLIEAADIENPNNVKVVTNSQGRALYFSRAAIPFNRDNLSVTYFKHIGIYGYKRDTLLKISQLPISTLENIEKLENLRMLENDFAIYLNEVKNTRLSIDTIEDYEKAQELWRVHKK